jgi:hypothetical protein
MGGEPPLPDVRHRIQISRHFPDMSEFRVTIDDEHVYRVLVGFGPGRKWSCSWRGTRQAQAAAGTTSMSR